jgi:hypothetical protein
MRVYNYLFRKPICRELFPIVQPYNIVSDKRLRGSIFSSQTELLNCSTKYARIHKGLY